MAFKVCVLLGGLALLCSFADASMQCFHLRDKDSSLLSEVKNAVTDLPVFNTCPPPLINQDQEYCCYGWDLKPYCCDAGNVILNWSVIAVVILIILMLLSTIVSCVCCLCCPCCCLYKRRQGRVYHHKQSVISTSSQTPIRQPQSTDYQPIAKSHTNLPPGAYPVFPPGSGPKYYTRSP